jgi:hypothetical protein
LASWTACWTVAAVAGRWAGTAVMIVDCPRREGEQRRSAMGTSTGAIVSHLATGYDVGEVALLAAMTALTVLSWALRPPSRRTR